MTHRDLKEAKQRIIGLKEMLSEENANVMHELIDHDKELVDENHDHINGIRGFWSFSKENFHGDYRIDKENYPFYVKEMEFRFNHRNESIFNLLFDTCIRRLIQSGFRLIT